jgi:hypothetical protein
MDSGFFNQNNTLAKHGTKDIQVLHYAIWPWRILNGACISIFNLPENLARQIHKDDVRPEARAPLLSGAWGGCPTCHPQTPPVRITIQFVHDHPLYIDCPGLLITEGETSYRIRG